MIFVALALAIQAPASAQPSAETDGAETLDDQTRNAEAGVPDIQRPDASYLLVEIINPPKMIGIPKSCLDPDVSCLMELYEAPVRVIDHLGGAPTNRRLNIRFTAHSFHSVWKKDRRFLLSVFPFEDNGREGHFAFNWDWENENQEFCIEEDGLADTVEPIRKFYRSGRTFVTGEDDPDWYEGIRVRCVKGKFGQER